MKITHNKKILSKIERFSKLKKALKNLSDEEALLKIEIKNVMVDLDTKVLIAGDYAVAITDRFRTEIDKKMLEQLLGEDLKHALRMVEYQIFEVKKS